MFKLSAAPRTARSRLFRSLLVAVLLAPVGVALVPDPATAAPSADTGQVGQFTESTETPQITATRIDPCHLACGSPAVVASGTPSLHATAVDPSGAFLRLEFEVYDSTRGTLLAASGTAVGSVPSGVSRQWRVTPLAGGSLPEASYEWRVRACNTAGCGDYSPWLTFRVIPVLQLPKPTVTGDPYVEDVWAGGVGQPGQFTFANSSPDVVEYVYSLNYGNYVTRPAGELQAERLTANQQQIVTGIDGFTAGDATLERSTTLGRRSAESLRITPTDASETEAGAAGDTYAAIGGDQGGMRLGMQAGKRYAISGWIYVPADTGLEPTGAIGRERGLRIVAFYRVGPNITEVRSTPAFVTGGWQRLAVQLILPPEATNAYVRLYNGFEAGSGKSVHWDELSVREVVGTTAVETLIPDVDGGNTVAVQARDIAGNISATANYHFLVAPVPAPDQWRWRLDEGTGGVAVSSPADHPAQLSSGGVSWATPGRVGAAHLDFDGTGELTTTGPVLDTTAPAGFTVAAWVRLTSANTVQTAVSQDGARTSMFRLGFRNDRDVNGDGTPDDAWCFSAATADDVNAGEAAACTTAHVTVGGWVSLIGIYHRVRGELRIYVNGLPDLGGAYASVEYYSDWAAPGSFAIGRGQQAGPVQHWIGGIDDVRAARRVWVESEIVMYAFS